MKKSNKIKALIAILLLIALTPMTVTTSSATPPSPPSERFGQSVSDANIPKDIGVIIEEQNITFDLLEFPKLNSEEMLDGSIPGSVRIDYSLYNPTEKEISFDISYHFGKASGSFEYYDHIETDKYSILVNGEPVDFAVRYGIDLYYNNYYHNDNDLSAIIFDEYISGEYCSPDMTVTKYTFEQGDVDRPLYHGIAFDIGLKELSGVCLYLDGIKYSVKNDDGSYRVSAATKEKGSTYDLYVFGGSLTEIPEWSVYMFGNTVSGEAKDGNVTLISTETMTLSEFASSKYDSSLGINELDWYNIIATELSLNIENSTKVFDFNCFKGEPDNFIFGGLLHEITLAPGEHTVVTVNAPVYPTIETAYDPYTYTYRYNLLSSNAYLFTGKINVNIITPYHLLNNNNGYAKTEDGYSLSIEPLKQILDNISVTAGGFNFTLCEVENPEEVDDTNLGLGLVMIFVIIVYGIMQVFDYIMSAIQSVTNWVSGLFNF